MNLFLLLSLSCCFLSNFVTADISREVQKDLYGPAELKEIIRLRRDASPSTKQASNSYDYYESVINHGKETEKVYSNGDVSSNAKRALKKRAAQKDNDTNNDLGDVLKNVLTTFLQGNGTDLKDILSQIPPDALQNILQQMQGGLGTQSTNSADPFQMITQLGQGSMKIYSPTYKTSTRCTSERGAVMSGLGTGQIWAMTMVDSVGKLGSGVFQGNSWLIGNFDGCKSVRGVTAQGDIIIGSFVEYTIKIPLPAGFPSIANIVPGQTAGLPKVMWQVCLPSGCSEKDVKSIGAQFVREIGAGLERSRIITKKDPSDDPAFIIAIIILAILALICLIGTVIEVTSEEGRPQSGLNRCFLAFSLNKNLPDIFKAKHAPGEIGCLHGIRVISISWVILGHTYFFGPQFGNPISYLGITKQWTYNAIINGTRAVDTFFLLSGCLVAYLFLRSAHREGGVKFISIVMYYVHRYLRLTPMYALVILVYTGITPYMEYGPFQDKNYPRDTVCREKWWMNLLYINNLRDDSELCLGWSWYLSNDMQFYILAPLVLVPMAVGKAAIGIVLACLGVALQLATCAALQVYYDANMLKNGLKFMAYIYFRPYTRCGPYAIGLILGYLLYKTKCKVKMNKIVVFIGWFLAIGGGLINIYVTQDNFGENGVAKLEWSDEETIAYDTLKRPWWALCVSWVIFACATGYGGMVNSFLSWQAWIPLSRLTFGTYLCHVWVYYYFNYNMKGLVNFDYNFVIDRYLTTFVLAYALSLIFSLLIETPVRNLIKPKKKRPTKPETKSEEPDTNGLNTVYTINGKANEGIHTTGNVYEPEPVHGLNGVENGGFELGDVKETDKVGLSEKM